MTGVAEAFFSFIDNFRKGNEAKIAEYDHRFVRTKKSLEVFIQVEKKEYIIGIRLDRFVPLIFVLKQRNFLEMHAKQQDILFIWLPSKISWFGLMKRFDFFMALLLPHLLKEEAF